MRKYFYTFAASVVFFIEWPERNERTLETWKTKTEKEVSTVLDAVVYVISSFLLTFVKAKYKMV
jgi:hypothetical protein